MTRRCCSDCGFALYLLSKARFGVVRKEVGNSTIAMTAVNAERCSLASTIISAGFTRAE